MGSLGVWHDWATSLSLFTFMPWRRKWQPTPVFLPGESQGRGAWWASIYGVAQSWIRLKRLSSSSHKEWTLAICDNMDGPEGIMLSETSQKKANTIEFHLCVCAQSCLTLCDSTDRSLSDDCVHGIFQARELEWGAITFSVYLSIFLLKSKEIEY